MIETYKVRLEILKAKIEKQATFGNSETTSEVR